MAMDTLEDDVALLEAIAQKRDQNAYTILYRRYSHDAFTLACHILGHQDRAEEAVQEALLRIWMHAASFRIGNIRSWILQIVARESLRILAKTRKRERREPSMQQNLSAGVAEAHSEDKEELLHTLRKSLETLPAIDRQLVALCYGGGLSHDEIGAALQMPRRTVSYKIQQALERLRLGLTQAGFSAALPLLEAPEFARALSSGAAAPAGLHAKVLRRLAESASPSARSALRSASERLAAKSKSAWLWGAVGMSTAGLLLAGGLLWKKIGRPAAVFDPAPAPTAVPAVPQRVPLYRKWDFKSAEQPDGITVLQGHWKHIPNGGSNGSAGMEISAENFRASFDFRIDTLPVLLTARIQYRLPLLSKTHHMGACWETVAASAHFTDPSETLAQPLDIRAGKWLTFKAYVTDTCVDQWLENTRLNLWFYEQPVSPDFVICSEGQVIRLGSLVLEEIAPASVPDTSAYRRALAQIEPSKRKGVVELPWPEARSPRKTITVKFTTEAHFFGPIGQ